MLVFYYFFCLEAAKKEAAGPGPDEMDDQLAGFLAVSFGFRLFGSTDSSESTSPKRKTENRPKKWTKHQNERSPESEQPY